MPDPDGSRLSPEELDPKVDDAHEHDGASRKDSDAHGRRRRRPASASKAFTCSSTDHHLHAADQGRQAPPLARTPLTQRPRNHHRGPPLPSIRAIASRSGTRLALHRHIAADPRCNNGAGGEGYHPVPKLAWASCRAEPEHSPHPSRSAQPHHNRQPEHPAGTAAHHRGRAGSRRTRPDLASRRLLDRGRAARCRTGAEREEHAPNTEEEGGHHPSPTCWRGAPAEAHQPRATTQSSEGGRASPIKSD